MTKLLILLALILTMYGEPKPSIKHQWKNDNTALKIEVITTTLDGWHGDNIIQKGE